MFVEIIPLDRRKDKFLDKITNKIFDVNLTT